MQAIIGGSGLYQLSNFIRTKRQVVRTPYGETSSPLSFGRFENGKEFVFLARHGHAHTLAPHIVNYRANLWALHEVGVSKIYSVSTVGGIDTACQAGCLVVPDQLIDYTWGRADSFFDNVSQPVFHADMSIPYSEQLRQSLIQAILSQNIPYIDKATYGCLQGPRLETAAEVMRYQKDGCSILGMTAMPEAALARELEIDYAAMCLVTNRAAGLEGSEQCIAFDRIEVVIKSSLPHIVSVLQALLN